MFSLLPTGGPPPMRGNTFIQSGGSADCGHLPRAQRHGGEPIHAGQLSAFTVGGRLALGSFCQTSPFRLYFTDSTTADFSPNRIGRQPRPCGGSPAVVVLSVE